MHGTKSAAYGSVVQGGLGPSIYNSNWIARSRRWATLGAAMQNWIIDDFGQIHRSGSEELHRSLGYNHGGLSLEKYAVENIGHIGITERDGCSHVRLRPAIVAQRAIASLFYWLLERPTKLVVLSWLDGLWHIEQAISSQRAIQLITLLLDTKSLTAPNDKPRVLLRPSVTARQRWETTAQEILPFAAHDSQGEDLKAALDALHNRRWMIVEVDDGRGTVIVVDHGDGFPPIDPDLAKAPPAFQVLKLRDDGYRKWVVQNYLEIAKEFRPHFDDIDAIIDWPLTGHTRTRYWRATIPIHRTPQSCRMIVLTGGDSSIDLRPKHIKIVG